MCSDTARIFLLLCPPAGCAAQASHKSQSNARNPSARAATVQPVNPAKWHALACDGSTRTPRSKCPTQNALGLWSDREDYRLRELRPGSHGKSQSGMLAMQGQLCAAETTAQERNATPKSTTENESTATGQRRQRPPICCRIPRASSCDQPMQPIPSGTRALEEMEAGAAADVIVSASPRERSTWLPRHKRQDQAQAADPGTRRTCM